MEYHRIVLLLLLPVFTSSEIHHLPSECSMEPAYGSCDGDQTRWFFNQTTGMCEWFSYSGCGGNGEMFRSHGECLHTCGCNAPPASGNCMSYFNMFYYNPTSGKCEPFVYGGCGGNENRFPSESACMQSCVCSRRPETGFCKAGIPAFYFDAEDNECKPFTYGGCGGNPNRFVSKKACDDQCVCNMEPDSGICLAYMPSIYYDKREKRCKDFIYGGCHGNGNRFNSMEACADTCSSNATLK